MRDETIKSRITKAQDSLVVDIGLRIKKLRMDHDLTQQGLADALGLSRAAVTQWENGQATCNFAQALELETIFGTDVGYILYGRHYQRLAQTSETGEAAAA
jgi:transcriptional regulator with XRE-family HTH domain